MKKFYSSTLRCVLIVFLCSATFVSCDQKTKTITIEGNYELDVPVKYAEVNDLNPEASLQYQNSRKNIFVIVIDETKETVATALTKNNLTDRYDNSLKGYSELITDGMDNTIAIKDKPEFNDIIIDNLKARELSFEGIASGNHVYWKLAFIEGKKRFYQVMVWTEAAEQKKHEREMQAIINSFRETAGTAER